LRDEQQKLRSELATTAKRLARERRKVCTLEYTIKEMETQQRRAKATVERTTTKVSVDVDVVNIGAATRQAMAALPHEPDTIIEIVPPGCVQ
jgi:phage regulator Rha-like protein